MYANGFLDQQRQRRSPASLAIVVALHAAAFGALILAGSSQFLQQPERRTVITEIPLPPDPQPVQPEQPDDERRTEPRETFLTTVPPIGPADGNAVPTGESDPIPAQGPTGEQTVTPRHDPPPDPPPPVRREAQLDPRYAGDLQPPYPRSEETAGRGGVVRIRLTISANGRVSAVQRLSATSEAFWRVTEQQALRRWRFRPATLDGRPVQGFKEMTVRFRIEDA